MDESADNITAFPAYNINNIPEALRKLANEIDQNPTMAQYLVVVYQSEDGICRYLAFGKHFTRAHSVGMLEYGKALIMGLRGG